MAVNRIQVGGSVPSPDRQDYNLVAGSGVTLTAADDSTNNVSKCTVSLGGSASDASSLPGSFSVAKFFGEGVGAVLASASTIAPTNSIHHVSGTTQITTITAPAIATGSNTVTIGLIPDGLWSTGTSGNIALGTTAVVSKVVWLTYDPVQSKWYPSY